MVARAVVFSDVGVGEVVARWSMVRMNEGLVGFMVTDALQTSLLLRGL